MKLKVLVLYQYFGTPKGSWSTRMYEMCKIWIEAGADVTVVTSPYDKSDLRCESFISRQEIEGIKLIVINSGDSNRHSTLKRVYRSLLFSFVSSVFAVFLRADVLIASSGPITIGIPGLIGTLFSKKKLVFEVRDLWPGGAIEMGLIRNEFVKSTFSKFEKLCYTRSSLVVPCSIGMEENMLQRFPKLKTLVVPNASDIDFFQNTDNESFLYPEWLKENTKLFLYTGSLGLMDACEEIISGFNLLDQKRVNTHLVFIGDGVERVLLERMVKELELEENVHFLGLIPKSDVAKWYKKATASFVVFKNFEILGTSSPNKMFDSLAAGVPIIQNTTGWIHRLVNERKIGINVEPNNSSSMSNAMSKFMNDEFEMSDLRINSLQCAKEMFDRKEIAMRYLHGLSSLQ